MEYEALSPRADVDPIKQIPISPRVVDLSQATIGLFSSHKGHWPLILEEIGKQIAARYPAAKFSRFQYTKDLNAYNRVAELAKDPEMLPEFEEWLKGIDTVIVGNGDAGSCTLYLTYNATLPERLGKPTVLTLRQEFNQVAQRAAQLRGVPALRRANVDIWDISQEPDLKRFVDEVIPERVAAALDDIIAALTDPLTPEEAAVPVQEPNTPRVAMKGSLEDIYSSFVAKGWSYGMPIMPPTEEAVTEMLTGTDLPRDHVVAEIPPMMGKATVEKIAINGVMAGCLPIHMPVLIAGVEALVDPGFWVEAYTCSIASWAPFMVINGPVRKDLGLDTGRNVLSPYRRGSVAIAHAVGLMIMNIGGVKGGREDMGIFGHEGRFGICIAENEEESPWEPLHVYYGLDKKDSAITLSWPNTRHLLMFPEELGAILRIMCDNIPAFGFDPGCTTVMSPQLAQFLHAHGFTRKALVDYLAEYARIPTPQLNVRWLRENFHEPKDVPLPMDATRSTRKFWSTLHLPIVVAGENYPALLFYGGGGDHGGPVTAKIRLPGNWDELVERYGDCAVQWRQETS
ncbi:MAG: hypothetical protein GX604_08625 [Actinobacteria bacterium]|nr:hypothetical protein [Actinomycetota bacterium]